MVHTTIKYWNLWIFSKFPIGVETTIHLISFISLVGLKFKKHHFCEWNLHQEKIARNGHNTLQGWFVDWASSSIEKSIRWQWGTLQYIHWKCPQAPSKK